MQNEQLLADIDSVLSQYSTFEEFHKKVPPALDTSGYAKAPPSIISRVNTLFDAAINRLAPPNSAYKKQYDLIRRKYALKQPSDAIESLAGVLQALRDDYEADRVSTFQELVHSELFSDMLEAAEYLLGETYKDPAAVMAGGVLEQHLRELCRKHGVDLTFINSKGDTKPKMTETMNTDLAKKSAYGKIEQKQVTAWAGIRNAAAHGEYGKYDENQVRQMVRGIRDFISKYPA